MNAESHITNASASDWMPADSTVPVTGRVSPFLSPLFPVRTHTHVPVNCCSIYVVEDGVCRQLPLVQRAKWECDVDVHGVLQSIVAEGHQSLQAGKTVDIIIQHMGDLPMYVLFKGVTPETNSSEIDVDEDTVREMTSFSAKDIIGWRVGCLVANDRLTDHGVSLCMPKRGIPAEVLVALMLLITLVAVAAAIIGVCQ